MRTTLTIDDDVAAALDRERIASGEPFKQLVNRVLRRGLMTPAKPAKLRRFQIRPRNLGVPAEWFEGSTQELFDRLDGPCSR